MSAHEATTTAPVVELSELPSGLEKLGSGGEGVVYKLGSTHFSSRPCAFKKYKSPDKVNEAHLEKLVKFINKLGEVAPDRKEWLLNQAAWPTHLVRDNGKTIGIIMPLIPDRFFQLLSPTSTSTTKRAAELQYLLNGPEFEQSIGLKVSERQRYEFLEDCANLLRVLHGAEIRVGDISVKNLLFCHNSPGPHVYLLDCDSMSIGPSEGPDVQTPGWDVPNGEKPQTKKSDAYKFGLLALRLLASDQSTRNPNDLPAGTVSSVRSLTQRALTASSSSRPTPRDWLGAISEGKEKASTEVAEVASPKTQTTSAKSSAGTSTATKTISRRKQGRPVPSAVSTNAVGNTPATAQTTAPASTNATSTTAAQPANGNTNSTEKKGLGWPITWTILAGLMCLLNFVGGHPGSGAFMLIVFITNLCWLLVRMDESKDSSQ